MVIHDGLVPEDPGDLTAFSAYPPEIRDRILTLEARSGRE
jgi:hypothetical protein